jgi:NAD(P)-dependent dehydrogenase (short-subunit alcohol dehydrogenase family)
MRKPLCAVVGVGEGNGASLARAFARTGMAVALLARRTDFTRDLARELSDARPYACDVSDPQPTFKGVESGTTATSSSSSGESTSVWSCTAMFFSSRRSWASGSACPRNGNSTRHGRKQLPINCLIPAVSRSIKS